MNREELLHRLCLGSVQRITELETQRTALVEALQACLQHSEILQEAAWKIDGLVDGIGGSLGLDNDIEQARAAIEKATDGEMTTNKAMIDRLTVTSRCGYIVYGAVRGLVSEHRTLTGALRAIERDRKGCASQRGYSDACVYEWTDEGWSVVDAAEGRP